MRISSDNGNISVKQSSSTNFKSAIPVFVHVGKSVEESAPITTPKYVRGYMQKLSFYLNDTLKRGKDLARDNCIDRFRQFFKSFLTDFQGKVKAFTCVDGGQEGGILKPLFYLATGSTKDELTELEKEYVNTRKNSGGYKTAEMEDAKKKYYLEGKSIVEKGFKLLSRTKSPIAMHVYFEDIYDKKGNIKEHEMIYVEMKATNEKNPIITLEKEK